MLTRTLNFIERQGNRLPNPTLLFIYLCIVVALLSWLANLLTLAAAHPITDATITAKSLISRDGLHFILENTIKNFVTFAPVGSVLVAIMGIGIAEHSGLIGSLLRTSVLKAPKKLITFAVIATSILSSIALDIGYVVLIPLAGMVFQALGRNPLVGIFAAFAGVSGGFSANLLIGPVDSILAGISTESSKLIAPDYQVSPAGNYYFIIASTLLISLVGTLVTEKIIAKWLPEPDTTGTIQLNMVPGENRGLKAAGVVTIIFAVLLLAGLIPENGVLRGQDGAILRSPFISGIIVIISIYAALAGWAFATFSQQNFKKDFVVDAMEKHMSAMSGYLVLMFFASQFVNYFGWTQLGSIFAIKGAELLALIALPKIFLLIAFIFLASFINLFIGSSSAKWALIAPIFLPMFLLLGISPEATQMAYRIGDSSTNIITPLMPYFGAIVAFAQRYDRNLGIGTLISVMLPYSFAFLLSWSLLFLIWAALGLELGPGAPIYVPQ